MNDNVFKAALAGLLHDIGKFAQRAGEGMYVNWNQEEEKEFKYQHAAYTDGVLAEIVPTQWVADVRGAASHHHRPTNSLEQVVSLADRLSAGERSDSGDQPPRLLQSIFCSLDGVRDEQGRPIEPPQGKYLPLKKLAIAADTVFPVDESSDAHWTYKELWDQFLAEAKALKAAHEPTGNQAVYLESLLNLMQQYTWSIPSAYYKSVPDISLYDHSRMTAALAACLVDLPELPAVGSETPAALLVGGDISGVQSFIYTITSQGATSGLRGRSMYLQLLTETIARYVLNELELPAANIIYAGGGHFFMLAPVSAEARLAELRQQISQVLLHHHQGDLYLALAWASLTPTQAAGNALRQRWDEMQQGLQRSKQRRFSELGAGLSDLLFAPKEDGGNEDKQCVVCQREHPGTKKWDNDDRQKCPACHEFEELGRDLRKARYLILDRVGQTSFGVNSLPGNWQEVLGNFGYQAMLKQALPSASGNEVISRAILALNDEAIQALQPAATIATGRHFLVNTTPTLTPEEYEKFKKKVDDLTHLNPANNPVKPFEVMARQSRGIKRLGVLRMDVDNLGQILSQGLAGDRFTFSRIATLSFNFTLFFEGWVAEIADQINETGRNNGAERQGVYEDSDLLYAIYSGGDDLFFVGAWDLMPLLAERISSDLEQFSAGHAGIHLSGGVALIPSKYPLYQAATDAADAEHAAKAPRRDGQAKNALNFLGQTMDWQKFEQVKGYQQTLIGLVAPADNGKAVPKSLLQKLQQLYTEFDGFRQEQEARGEPPKTYWGPGQWHSAYTLSRLANRHQFAKKQIEEIKGRLQLEQFTEIEWLGLAARWAALITRKSEE
ncbi:MAG: type III-A CRISPR-associated protein Cas10/Csm1 [Anaerolineae bacterium]